MTQSPTIRAFAGAITTMIFLGSAWIVGSGGHLYIGAFLAMLGAYRGVVWARELLWLLSDSEDDGR